VGEVVSAAETRRRLAAAGIRIPRQAKHGNPPTQTIPMISAGR
jgi:hypothetical protein